MEIASLPIPETLINQLREKNITELYPPQAEAINKGLLEDNNLVVAIPTASGKTLLGILAAMKCVQEKNLKVLYLSPLRALAYEKFNEFNEFFKPLKRRTVILTGDYDTEDRSAINADIIIATNEKVDSAIRHQAKWINNIGLIIADEVHLINDGSRGPILEVVLAQLRQLTQSQIVALSATIKNADEIARWLEAELVYSDWRPVKLNEGVLFGSTIKYADGYEKKLSSHYADNFNNLIENILIAKNQMLIFGTTRSMAESTAKKLAIRVRKRLTQEEKDALQLAKERILTKGEKTKQSRELAEMVLDGVSYHHAGLSPSQKRIVEDEFKAGNIKILSATPTLAAGLNLPARYVIIKSVYRYDITIGSHPIPVLEYKQQSGRAGRPQYDTEGDSIIFTSNEHEAKKLFERYILSDTEDIESKLASEPALRSIILGQIASENCQTDEELKDFFSQTFYGYQQDSSYIASILSKVITFLREEGLIKKDMDFLIATRFGKRVSQLYVDPFSAITIRSGLVKGKSMAPGLVTDMSFLQLICATPDVRNSTVKRDEQHPLMNYVNNHVDEFLTELPTNAMDLEFFLSETKTALILRDWINEVSEEIILERYGIGSGDVYAIVSNAEWILYATVEIAKLLGYTELSMKANNLHQRISGGIKEELLDLVQIPGIGRARARMLFDKGYKTLDLLKQANPQDILALSGFGKEIVKSIYDYLLGSKKSDDLLQGIKSSESEENELEEEEKNVKQKSLDYYFS